MVFDRSLIFLKSYLHRHKSSLYTYIYLYTYSNAINRVTGYTEKRSF